MKIDGNTIRPGYVLEHQGGLWVAVKTSHTQPGKGGAYLQVEMKNLTDGRKLNERFRASEKVEKVRLEQDNYTYLYANGDMHVFMHVETYDQIEISEEFIGEKTAYLQENMAVKVESYEGKPLSIQLPTTVILTIEETEPALKGQTQKSSNKPALMENGVRVMVPTFVNQGDKIVVNTVDNSYSERAK